MNSDTDLEYENSEERSPSADESKPRQNKKAWVTPIVSASPVNELSAAGPFVALHATDLALGYT